MSRKLTRLLSLVVVSATIIAEQSVEAWQSPDELPTAPRLNIDDAAPATDGNATTPAPVTIINDASDADSGFSVINPPPAPAPAIIPVEEIIAEPATIAPTARRRPSDDVAPVAPTLDPQPEATTHNLTPQSAAPRLKATLFKQAEPGVTTTAELKQLWGEPTDEKVSGDATRLTFALQPFSRVDAMITGGVIQSIVVYFDAPADAEATVTQLGLAALAPANVIDEDGKVVGRAYPERGVTFTYTSAGDASKIAQLRLAPLTASSFLLRVHGDRENRWSRNLADLAIAASLSPDDERIHWLRSEVLMQQAEYRDAALAIEKALQARPDVHLYQLTAAKLIAHAGNYEEAIAATSAVLQSEDLPRLLKAKAALQLGDMLAESPRRDFTKALEFHQYAIQVAVPLATHQRRDIRGAAKQLLIAAHAAVAGDIAQGTWKNKAQSVPLWADRSQALVAEYIKNENGPASVEFEILCRRLHAYAWVNGQIDPSGAIAQLGMAFDNFNSSATDATFVRHVKWQYGKAMIDAVDIERARGNPSKALEYGEAAETALTSIADDQWQAEKTQFQLSRLYFLLGSVQAVHRDDHAAAVNWFDKALDDISRPEPDKDLTKTARRGHWLVSMGVSYWHSDRKDDALRLTQGGVGLIEKAQAAGAAKDSSLAAPYNNLAFMHEQLGNDEQAKQFAALAEKQRDAVQR